MRCLREHLPDGVKVGTVDKFQGQEAAVCFFSMATSSGEEIPRNLEFLFSRNRLNVAVSRARCLAVLVCNPALLEIRCRNAEQMRLLTRFACLWRWPGKCASSTTSLKRIETDPCLSKADVRDLLENPYRLAQPRRYRNAALPYFEK